MIAGYDAYYLKSVSLAGNTLLGTTPPVSTSGWYYVNGAALMNVAPGDAVTCFISSVQDGLISTEGGSNIAGTQTTTISAAPFLNAGDVLQLYCGSYLQNLTSQIFNAGFTAVLVNSSNNATPQALKASKQK